MKLIVSTSVIALLAKPLAPTVYDLRALRSSLLSISLSKEHPDVSRVPVAKTTSAHWFDDLSPEAQAKYLKIHPDSKMGKPESNSIRSKIAKLFKNHDLEAEADKVEAKTLKKFTVNEHRKSDESWVDKETGKKMHPSPYADHKRYVRDEMNEPYTV